MLLFSRDLFWLRLYLFYFLYTVYNYDRYVSFDFLFFMFIFFFTHRLNINIHAYSEKNKHKINLHTTYVIHVHVFQTDVAHTRGITQNFKWRPQRTSRMMSCLSLEIEDTYKFKRSISNIGDVADYFQGY